jgi:hypothetical protein
MEKLYIQDDVNRKRLAEYAPCLHCKNEFLRAKKGKRTRKFCSKECFNNFRINQIELTCHSCGRNYTRPPSKAYGRSKNNVSFCSNECKFSMQTLDCPDAPALPSHYGKSDGRGANYRKRASIKSKIMIGCGCGEKREYLLVIHHIDGNRTNNQQENLECVCANCHIIRHLIFKNGQSHYSPSALTPRELILFFEKSAEPE